MCDVVAPIREEYDAAFLRLVEVTNEAEAEEGAPEPPQPEPGYNVHGGARESPRRDQESRGGAPERSKNRSIPKSLFFNV